MEDGLTEEAQAFRERHGIRVCQDCLTTVRRQQDKMHPAAPPTWYKMHELLIELQAEVDAALPALQEQILSSSATLATLTPSQRAALLASRKKILTLLASIDSLGKRIKEYPLAREHTIGGAQDRLLRSIANRSTIFLQDRMGLLKGLGSFDDLPPSAEPAGANGKRQSVVVVDLGAAQAMEARAEQLSVLLECVFLDFLKGSAHSATDKKSWSRATWMTQTRSGS
jgi:rabenosyn-5